ncbi:MAG TPA: thiamine pyrophosphate-binding protein [Gaiellaceae bacterium]|jgi:benzoylformate decarboxylase|nr:thiamine pyrophosphate-binding protein [Gaiellaceae bacterium]
MSGKTGRFAIIEQFLADGMTVMFGNPGTVEQGFLDALGDYPDFRYILTLQETIAVAMADGYARATQRPALVQLHTGVGLGNGIGMLYQAKRGYAPIVVVAAEAGIRYDALDAQMAADLVAMAEPVTKWATRVVDPGSVLRVLRRAVKIAATPPTGPVFVDLPMDVLDAPCEEAVVPTSLLDTRVVPIAETVARAAKLLAAGSRPLIVMGDGVAFSGAQEELTRLAELLGAEVWGANSSEVNIAADHPLFRGQLGHMFGDHSRAITSQADAVLICGTYVFPEVFPALDGVFGEGARVVHVDLDAYEIAKNFPVDLGIVADPKLTLGLIADELERTLSAEQREAAARRAAELAELRRQELEAAHEADRAFEDAVPMHASVFMAELGRQVPEDVIVFDEALTVSPDLTHHLVPTRPGHYFQTRGGSLGVGIPGAIAIKLAHPDKTVIGLTGDGGSMYTIQALWTAAHHEIGAKFVICNNRSYELLKLNLQQYWRERDLPERDFPASFDLAEPDLRFDELARAMGVAAARVETPDQVEGAIAEALAHPGPYLIDVVLQSEVPGHEEALVQRRPVAGTRAHS